MASGGNTPQRAQRVAGSSASSSRSSTPSHASGSQAASISPAVERLIPGGSGNPQQMASRTNATLRAILLDQAGAAAQPRSQSSPPTTRRISAGPVAIGGAFNDPRMIQPSSSTAPQASNSRPASSTSNNRNNERPGSQSEHSRPASQAALRMAEVTIIPAGLTRLDPRVEGTLSYVLRVVPPEASRAYAAGSSLPVTSVVMNSSHGRIAFEIHGTADPERAGQIAEEMWQRLGQELAQAPGTAFSLQVPLARPASVTSVTRGAVRQATSGPVPPVCAAIVLRSSIVLTACSASWGRLPRVLLALVDLRRRVLFAQEVLVRSRGPRVDGS